MIIDIWYKGEKPVKAVWFFCDLDCIYRGNFYNEAGRIIGDFSGRDSVEIEKRLNEVLNSK